jgi:hypothetical protein
VFEISAISRTSCEEKWREAGSGGKLKIMMWKL